MTAETSFGCWEQSHTIKSDGLGMMHAGRTPARLIAWTTQAWGGGSKTGSQVQVDAHKKEAKCQYKEDG